VKGQTQALTAALVTSVVVLSVAGAFTFGSQVLNKQQAEQNLQTKEAQVLELYNSINRVAGVEGASGGQGSSTVVDLSLDSGGVTVNEDLDYIEITTSATNPPYPAGTWSLVRGQRETNLSFGSGAYGEQSQDLDGVLAARPVSASQDTTVRYRIEFRNMLVRTPSGRRLDRVDLRTPEQETASDPESIRIENVGTETDSGSDAVELPTGEKIDRTRTILEVTFD